MGSDVENVGYVIPTPVVTHFLDDYTRTGTFSGFPALGVQWQRMESDALRRAYGMAPGQKGEGAAGRGAGGWLSCGTGGKRLIHSGSMDATLVGRNGVSVLPWNMLPLTPATPGPSLCRQAC